MITTIWPCLKALIIEELDVEPAEQLNLLPANPVIRHGTKVSFEDMAKSSEYKIAKINEWKNKGYKTIAIICKDEKEATTIYEKILNSNIAVMYITDNQTEYKGQVIVTTSSLAKGLEFDAAIINDASSNVYSIDSKLDMHLLYVASTRALHELEILYDKQLCPVFSNADEKTHENKKKLKRYY